MAAEVSSRGKLITSTKRLGDLYKKQISSNKFHKTKNPEGVLDLGSADNKICEDLILSKLRSPDVPSLTPGNLYYDCEDGTQQLKDAVVSFLKVFFKAQVPLTSNNVVITTGLHTGLEQLVYSVADPGDTLLTPTPFWDKVPKLLSDRCGVFFEEVLLHREENYTLSMKSLEVCYTKAVSEGRKVKGLFLINPNNPLGVAYKEDKLLEILQFAKKYKLHVILDEIYTLSYHGDDRSCCSVLSLADLPDRKRTHIAWSLSKDFGLSGFRTGVLVSWNQQMLTCLKTLAFYSIVPTPIQAQAAWLLQQHDWLKDIYLPTLHQRLRESIETYQQKLEAMGATVFPPEAGLYLWTDLSKFMDEPTFAGEQRLMERCIRAGVFFRPGQIFHAQSPGYIRFIFTLKPELLNEGLRRLEKALRSPDIPEQIPHPISYGDLDLNNMEILEVGTRGGSAEDVEDIVRKLQKCIKDSDWLNPSVPQREVQEKVWTVMAAEKLEPETCETDIQPQAESSADGSSSLDDLMISLHKSITPEWLSANKGQWEKENPQAAEAFRKAMQENTDSS